ncbi:hypothetical protein GGF37_000761 [Kickxella alabastrina]|nr:hypothetical protein GGF37_000761 [Kickxella alabastrina]
MSTLRPKKIKLAPQPQKHQNKQNKQNTQNKQPQLLPQNYAHQWSEKQERILYNHIYDEYLDNAAANSSSVSIDWKKVANRVRVESEICKSKFYDMQSDLKDQTQPRVSLWTRAEIERVVRGARDEEKKAMRAGKVEADWTRVAEIHTTGRSPAECKRIYDMYYHLCRTKLGIFGGGSSGSEDDNKKSAKILGIMGVAGLVCVFVIFEPFAAALLQS